MFPSFLPPPRAGENGAGIQISIDDRQVALRFLLRQPGTFTIPKASTVTHVEENAGAANVKLEPEEIDRIDAAFPLGPIEGGLPRL